MNSTEKSHFRLNDLLDFLLYLKETEGEDHLVYLMIEKGHRGEPLRKAYTIEGVNEKALMLTD